jgi:hypothetical protein
VPQNDMRFFFCSLAYNGTLPGSTDGRWFGSTLVSRILRKIKYQKLKRKITYQKSNIKVTNQNSKDCFVCFRRKQSSLGLSASKFHHYLTYVPVNQSSDDGNAQS